jgi:hypothetical protein
VTDLSERQCASLLAIYNVDQGEAEYERSTWSTGAGAGAPRATLRSRGDLAGLPTSGAG